MIFTHNGQVSVSGTTLDLMADLTGIIAALREKAEFHDDMIEACISTAKLSDDELHACVSSSLDEVIAKLFGKGWVYGKE